MAFSNAGDMLKNIKRIISLAFATLSQNIKIADFSVNNILNIFGVLCVFRKE